MPKDTWTHIAATYDGGFIRLYVNQLLVATIPYAHGPLQANNNPVTIGGRTCCNEPFNGRIDGVEIHSVAKVYQQPNTLPVWSGGCQSHGRGSGWATYCLNGADLNTAQQQLSVAGDGNVTVLRSGWYKLEGWADQHGCGHKRASIVINGTERVYSHNYDSGTQWSPGRAEIFWPLRSSAETTRGEGRVRERPALCRGGTGGRRESRFGTGTPGRPDEDRVIPRAWSLERLLPCGGRCPPPRDRLPSHPAAPTAAASRKGRCCTR